MEKQGYCSGFISIIGCPNVGKSTLLNRLVGQKVAIVSQRSQTTRNKITGVLTRPGYQMVFLDTPGVAAAKNRLGDYMLRVAYEALNEVEAILFLVDPINGLRDRDMALVERLKQAKGAPRVGVINKADAASMAQMDTAREFLQQAGCFEKIMDVQCFDLRALESLRNNPSHREVSAEHYASPFAKSCLVDNLDAAILGATEIDLNFNVNVHTDSNGRIMGGSGGHSDVAAGAKLAIVVAPLSRARLPIVVEKVLCTSTPGQTIDVFVTQKGIAVNPRQKELAQRLRDAQLPVKNMEELYQEALSTCGKPATITRGDQAVAHVLYRNGTLLDTIWNV